MQLSKSVRVAMLGVVSGVLCLASLSAAEPPLPANAIFLTTKHMCCAKESVPAMKEMYKIPGVARVIANHKTRTLIIIPAVEANLSPKAMWEAAERVKLKPLSLATADAIYESKPKR